MPTTTDCPSRRSAPAHPQTVRFRQNRATVLLSTGNPAAAAHARATLYAYDTTDGGHARWTVSVALDPEAANRPTPRSATPVEIGPSLTAAHHRSGRTDVFHVPEHRSTITLDPDQDLIDVRCANQDAAVHFAARLVRQAMTAQVLAAGAVYAHTAAVSIGGRGVLISGHHHRGKTTTLTATLRHLRADFVTNDRLLVTADGRNAALRGDAWPAHMRTGIGTLLAYPDLEDLVPTRYRDIDTAALWTHRSKVSIEPPDFPRLISRGTVVGSCPINVMIWPDIAPHHIGAHTEPVDPDEVRARLLATELFMNDPETGVSSHINHWLVAAPPAGQQNTARARTVDAIASSVPCYRLRAGGDPAAIAAAVAEVVPR